MAPDEKGKPTGGEAAVVKLSPEAQAITRSWARFSGYIEKGKPERFREARNHDLNDGTNYRHWRGLDQTDIRAMALEGRHPHTIPFLKQSVATITGSIIADEFRGDYIAGFQYPKKYAAGIKELFVRDRRIGNWEHKEVAWIREAFIYRGTLAWRISTDFDPRGTLDLEHIPADRMVYDPNWMTVDVNDNDRIFEYTYTTLRRLMEDMGDQAPWLASYAKTGTYMDDIGGAVGSALQPWDMNPDMMVELDGQLLVINEYWLEKRSYDRVFDPLNNVYLDEIPEKNRREFVDNERMLAGRGQTHGILAIKKDVRRVEKFQTYCPTITTSKMLAKGDYPVQVNGYHFLPITSDMINGKPNTPTDTLSDVQMMINKRMTTETYILATNGTNGVLANRQMFANDDEFDRWINEGHKPGYKGELSDMATADKFQFVKMPTSNVQTDFLNSTNNLFNMKEQLTPAVAATRGESKAGESGLLFQEKRAQANVTMIVPKSFIKGAYTNLYQTYFSAAKWLYTYPITLHGEQTNATYRFNYGDEDSIEISEISKLSVVVAESNSSPSKRGALLSDASQAMQYMDPASLRARKLSGIIAGNLPNLSDEDRMGMDEAGDIDDQLYLLRAQAEISELQAKAKQAQAGAAQPMTPAQPAAAAPASA